MGRRDYAVELANRIKWIKKIIDEAGAKGAVFGNSGGKDSALVGILCKKAGVETLGVIMPCQSKTNYGLDKEHALLLSGAFDIPTIQIDLTKAKDELQKSLSIKKELALNNINPRLRMTVLYAIGQEKEYLVAGTGNLSEITMGYFTKHGDGACDFNPIADLTASEVKEFLKFLNVPNEIISKAPSAGLWDGQTDEQEMGILYSEIDEYILTGKSSEEIKNKIEKAKEKTQHKRELPKTYSSKQNTI